METSKRNLSDFWRRDRSADAARELVSILHGADMLIGNMGSDIRVTWSGDGMSCTDLERRTVALDYGPLRGRPCPLPGTVVDEVIGYAAHEGGHCLWTAGDTEQTIIRQIQCLWSSLPSSLQRDWQTDQRGTLAEIYRLQNILEDGYIDYHIGCRWPVLREYIRIARNRLDEQASIDLEAIARGAFPDRNSIINLWVSVSLYGHSLPSRVSPQVDRALTPLLDLSQRAKGERDGVARHLMAVDAAVLLWQEFPLGEALPLHQSTQETSPASGRPSGGLRNLDEFDPATSSQPSGRQVVEVPRGLREAMTEAVAHPAEDLSDPVALVVGEDPRRLAAEARRADYDPERARRVISLVQQQVREVQASFLNQQHRKSRWHHGLQRGKLDDRRLWKPLVGDPGYFKLKDLAGRPSLAVGLLLDVSASMGRYMPVVEQTTAVFCQGLLPIPGIDFAAWWYTGQSGKMILTGICERRYPKLCLANVAQGGETPSGEAIAGVKVLMERMSGKQQLLIHFTDGRPDCPIHVRRAVQACRDAGIQVYAIGPSRYRELLASEYSTGSYETIEAVSELPEAVARLVKKLGVCQR